MCGSRAQTASCCSPSGVSDVEVVNSERFSVHSNSSKLTSSKYSVSGPLVPAAGDTEMWSQSCVSLRG